MFGVRIQTEPIARLAQPEPGDDGCGAEVCFVGKVRNDAKAASLDHLVLEHFPSVTESEINRIIGLARARWALHKAQVVHRVGRIGVGEDIVLVKTASAHRKDAYEANVFIMDYLKTEAPFWKQECFVDGTTHWVQARASDERAAQRWAVPASRDATPVHRYRIGALILAGGKGRRMGGRNKGLQSLRGRPLVQHVAEVLQPHVEYLAISANQDLAEYESLGFPVFPDDARAAVPGPLAGILSAFPRFPFDLDALLVAPCDSPLLPADLVPRLARALFAPQGPPAAMAATSARVHPSIFMCRPGMLISLIPHLQGRSDYRLHAWLESGGCDVVRFDDEHAFANINDLQALQALQS